MHSILTQFSIINLCNNIGFLFYNLGEYEKSLEVSQKSIVIKESSRYTAGNMISLNLIFALNDKLGRCKLSEEHALKALNLPERKENLYYL